MFRDEPQVLEDILEGLFDIALADGRYHEGEEGFLNRVAEIFGVPAAAFDCIEARHLAGRSSDPWQVLGVPRDSELSTVRARWRDLVRANHPDKMIARGLPVETVNLANTRLAAINAAWEEISARRKPASRRRHLKAAERRAAASPPAERARPRLVRLRAHLQVQPLAGPGMRPRHRLVDLHPQPRLLRRAARSPPPSAPAASAAPA